MRTFFIGLKELLLNIAFIVFYIMPLCVVSAVIYLILFFIDYWSWSTDSYRSRLIRTTNVCTF